MSVLSTLATVVPFSICCILSAFHATAQVEPKASYITNIDGNRFFVAEFRKVGTLPLSYQLSSNLVSWGAPGTGGRPTVVESVSSDNPQVTAVRINRPINGVSRFFIRAGFPKSTARLDFDGDGKSDFALVRNVGGGTNGIMHWIILLSGGGTKTIVHGNSLNSFVPADYDGDGLCDAAVYLSNTSQFRILQSSNGVVRTLNLGTSEHTVKVMGDYDGDGKDDPVVYRSQTGANRFSYVGSLGNPLGAITDRIAGTVSGSYPNPGDYDGDGKMDACVQTSTTRVLRRSSDNVVETITFGEPTDVVTSGDFDGDGKDDFIAIRPSSGKIFWHILERDGGGTGAVPIELGASASDFVVPADYDGDGKIDVAAWNATTGFKYRRTTNGEVVTVPFGQPGDYPVANTYVN